MRRVVGQLSTAGQKRYTSVATKPTGTNILRDSNNVEIELNFETKNETAT